MKVDIVDESVKLLKSEVLIKIAVSKKIQKYKQLRCADLTRGLTVSVEITVVKCEGAQGIPVYILIIRYLNHQAFIFIKQNKKITK